jgi:hypothetical protein
MCRDAVLSIDQVTIRLPVVRISSNILIAKHISYKFE